jgi:hypothetical protein
MTFNRVAQFAALFLIPAILSNSPAYAAKRPHDAAAVKEEIAARGVDEGVRVTLSDGTEAIGAIVSIADQGFTLRPKGADEPRSIDYAQITGVQGDGLSIGANLGIWVMLDVVVLVAALVSIARGEASLAKQR